MIYIILASVRLFISLSVINRPVVDREKSKFFWYFCSPGPEGLSADVLPKVWKTVTPIFKKGDRYSASNYKPISLTPIVVKIMERIIVTQIRAFCFDHNIIPKQQHGFTPGRSVITNLLLYVDD